jgi:outer membrane protein OmpA-like peptidoglycan-associated protein
MITVRSMIRLGLMAGLLGAAASAYAEETVIFNGPAPQAADLARILWPNKHGAQAPAGATRSIRINPGVESPGPAPRPSSEADYALTEPVISTDAEHAPAADPGSFGFLIHFGFNSTDILPESRPYLDSVGAMLRLPEARGRSVVIVGHTDAVGSEQYNQGLSERRAAAVRAYIAREFGIPADRLKIEGKGKREPITGADPYAPENRRVEFRAEG